MLVLVEAALEDTKLWAATWEPATASSSGKLSAKRMMAYVRCQRDNV